jgi:hypothetical protein
VEEVGMKRLGTVSAVFVLLAGAACHTNRPLWSATPGDKTTPGTIAGIMRTAAGDVLPGRRVNAIQVGTSQSYSAVTNVTGGFSIPVPPGKYRLEPELREGESVLREPGVVDINKSDLDANLEIVVGS